MTISYTSRVSRVRLLGFTRLLLLWKASIYKLLYREILIYCVLYTVITLVYRLALKIQHKRNFAKLVFYFSNFESLIPITFILGFYVTLVAQRWWNQYMNIPWPDRIMPYIANHVTGSDERGRMLRRTLMRYLMISETLIFQSISPRVKVRFPTLEHVVEAGIMTKEEKKMYEGLPSPHHKYWVPCQWFANLLHIARQEGRIVDDYGFNKIYDEMIKFKSGLGTIYSYDWVSIPLVYTQVATISVYVFFFTSLISRQFIDPNLVKELTGEMKHQYLVDLYIPGFTIFQLFFYLGWLKVAEQMINPFGEDDDDFDVNYILDRNFQVGMMAVDKMYCQVPTLERDQFWDETEPQLPYTRASQRYFQEETWMGSMAHINFPDTSATFVPMERISEHCNAPNMDTAHTRNVFGSGSTFFNQKKGGLSMKFLNSRFDFLKSAPQINSTSLYDLQVEEQPTAPPIIHASIPHDKFPCQPLLSYSRCGRRDSVRPVTSSQVPQPSVGTCKPPGSEGEADKLVEAWIQDEKNAFPSTEALNAPLSNSTGNLMDSMPCTTNMSGIANGGPPDGKCEEPYPRLELPGHVESPTNPSDRNSLSDLRFTVSQPITDTEYAVECRKFTVTDGLELPMDEKRVVFEADTHGSSGSSGGLPFKGVVSKGSTLDSTCSLIGQGLATVNISSAHKCESSKQFPVNSSGSDSDGSAIDSVRAIVNMSQTCATQNIRNDHSAWPIRRDSFAIVQKSC